MDYLPKLMRERDAYSALLKEWRGYVENGVCAAAAIDIALRIVAYHAPCMDMAVTGKSCSKWRFALRGDETNPSIGIDTCGRHHCDTLTLDVMNDLRTVFGKDLLLIINTDDAE